MAKQQNNIPKKLKQGKTTHSQEAKVPAASIGRGGIQTNVNIRWTRNRAFVAGAILGVPFLLATVVTFKSGNILIGCVLVGLAIFVGLIYLALRYIENNEF
ncbi:MAG: hypothetical protein AAFO95_02505 [Cyanobacteria bacterium J06600_6]